MKGGLFLLTQALKASNGIQHSLQRRHPHPKTEDHNQKLNYLNLWITWGKWTRDLLDLYTKKLKDMNWYSLQHISQQEGGRHDLPKVLCRLATGSDLLSLHWEAPYSNENVRIRLEDKHVGTLSNRIEPLLSTKNFINSSYLKYELSKMRGLGVQGPSKPERSLWHLPCKILIHKLEN